MPSTRGGSQPEPYSLANEVGNPSTSPTRRLRRPRGRVSHGLMPHLSIEFRARQEHDSREPSPHHEPDHRQKIQMPRYSWRSVTLARRTGSK